MKKHGYYCKVCGEYKANEKFSGKGHAAHICKKCAALPPDVRSTQMIENKLLSLPWRLSKEQVKWLHNKAHDKRPEIRELAQEQLNARFHPEQFVPNDLGDFEDFLLDEDSLSSIVGSVVNSCFRFRISASTLRSTAFQW